MAKDKGYVIKVGNATPLEFWSGHAIQIGRERFDILPKKSNDGQLYVFTDGTKSVCIRLRRQDVRQKVS